MKLIKTLKLIVATSLGIAISLSGAQAERQSWFFKPTGGRPSIPQAQTVADAGALFLGPEGDKTVYLTFDAGYANESVVSILDTLKKHDATGAFFILKGIVKNNPEVVKRMADEGHHVCNHTTTHRDVSKITDISVLRDELSEIESLYRELTGKEMKKFFRPPQGAYSMQTLEFCKTLGYTPVFWSFAYADWDNNRQPNVEKSLEKILSQTHDGMVLLLHPTSATNAALLDSLLSELTARGYSFGTLDELKSKCSA